MEGFRQRNTIIRLFLTAVLKIAYRKTRSKAGRPLQAIAVIWAELSVMWAKVLAMKKVRNSLRLC